MNNSIGFFDSGIGGLNVLAYCNERLQGYKMFYYGDNQNAPYGNKTKQEIEILAESGVKKLIKHGCKIIVLACNTVSTNCIKTLRKKFEDVTFIATTPTVPKFYLGKKTLVLCTVATERAISNKLNCDVIALKDLAEDIEKNVFDLTKVDTEKHLNEMRRNYDLVYLGCTHYIYLKNSIQKAFDNAKIDDGLEKVYRKLVLAIKNAQKQGFMTTVNRKMGLRTTENKNHRNYIVFLGKSKRRNKSVFRRLWS